MCDAGLGRRAAGRGGVVGVGNESRLGLVGCSLRLCSGGGPRVRCRGCGGSGRGVARARGCCVRLVCDWGHFRRIGEIVKKS